MQDVYPKQLRSIPKNSPAWGRIAKNTGKPGDLFNKYKKRKKLRPASAVVKSEQNASHKFYKKGKKKKAEKMEKGC